MPDNPYPKRAEFTQEEHPWQAVTRTIFEVAVGFIPVWVAVVAILGIESVPWVASSLVLTGAVTRIMAEPVVNEFLTRWVPWLAPAPRKD